VETAIEKVRLWTSGPPSNNIREEIKPVLGDSLSLCMWFLLYRVRPDIHCVSVGFKMKE
jgi:hypothetical protein